MNWDGETTYQHTEDNQRILTIPAGALFELDKQGISLRGNQTVITWDELHRMLVEPPAGKA